MAGKKPFVPCTACGWQTVYVWGASPPTTCGSCNAAIRHPRSFKGRRSASRTQPDSSAEKLRKENEQLKRDLKAARAKSHTKPEEELPSDVPMATDTEPEADVDGIKERIARLRSFINVTPAGPILDACKPNLRDLQETKFAKVNPVTRCQQLTKAISLQTRIS